MPVPSHAAVDALAVKLSRKWKGIDTARATADSQVAKIGGILADHSLVPSDCSLVVFGSLGRLESSVNSDVDWTLLVDGLANPDHLRVSQEIAARFKEAKLVEPGVTKTFGGLAFSHDIIHQIGGEADTNRNTTQRILLLLESAVVGPPDAYDRVIRGVLNRYLDNDISFYTDSGQRYRVPRFLLNDIVRYWRTMCVDYATKHRERQGEKWALKNAKLRLSRKLIFASGLLMCFNCSLRPAPNSELLFAQPDAFDLEPLLSQLRQYVGMTPLAILADVAGTFAKPETAQEIFDAYDGFLTMMNDGTVRDHLATLRPGDARRDKAFQEIRHLSSRFQEGLNKLLLDEHAKLADLTRKYGIF
jgi:predicted nucleotidyltransferase